MSFARWCGRRFGLSIGLTQACLAVFFYLSGATVLFSGPTAVIFLALAAWAWLTKDKKEETEMNTCPHCGKASVPNGHPYYPHCPSCYLNLMRSNPYFPAQVPGYAQGGNVSYQVPYNLPNQSSPLSYLVPTPATKPPVVEERAEPVYGWRAYRIAKGGLLMGVRAEWPERNFTATCSEGIGPDKETIKLMLRDDVAYRFWLERQRGSAESFCATHLEAGICSCGVYLRAKPEPYDSQFIIYAKVLAYGVVALDEDGNARASEVQIEALYVVPAESPDPLFEYLDWERLGNVLRGRYDVPVQVVGSLDALTEATSGASIPKARG